MSAHYVVDAHTHVFPPEIGAAREAFRRRDDWFADLYANPRASLATVDDLIESMGSAGIDHAVICGFPWRDAGLCQFHNDYMRDAALRFPDRLSWLGIVAPSMSNTLETSVLEIFGAGASGIGELNADAQGFDLTASGPIDVAMQICANQDKPVMLHASEPLGHSYPGKGTATPDKLLAFAVRHPDLRIVLAHWGGGLPFYELMPEAREALRNVAYDSAASTYLYDFGIFRLVIQVVGEERVIFASDFPILRQDRFLQRVASLQWTSDLERERVLSGNACRVYGMPGKGNRS